MVFRASGCITLLLISLLSACNDSKQGLNNSETDVVQISVEANAEFGQGGIAQARSDAIDKATSLAGAKLKSERTNPKQLMDIKVVDEWQDEHSYHVQLLANLSDKPLCGSVYRKKIVATAFPMMKIDQLSNAESQDLLNGIPREINNLLMEKGDFIGINLSNTLLFSKPELAPEILPAPNYYGSSILNIARQEDAQFILSGVIRDFKIENAQYLRGAGFLAEFKSLMRDMVSRRGIGIDVYVYDGFSGALLFQHRYTDTILGDVALPAGYAVGSELFNDTPAGHKIDQILHKAANDINQLLVCYPFASRVTDVTNNRIVIAAGAQNRVKVGDHFKVYPSIPNASGLGAAITESQGILTITDISPNAAMGKLDADAQIYSIHPGDWVKSANVSFMETLQ